MAAPFKPTDPLIRGRVVIEASAGTGKTWQITNLVLRLVAEEGVAIERVMVVTFTNAATAELRDRVRKRLAQALEALQAAASGGPLPTDEVLKRLCEAEARPSILQRLRQAREDFDAAPISTIHGFCNRVLKEHAFAAGVDPTAELVSSADEVLADLVDDWLTRRRYGIGAAELAFLDTQALVNRTRLLAVARVVAGGEGALRCGGQPLSPEIPQAVAEAARWWAGGGREDFTLAVDRANARGCFKSSGTWKLVKSGRPSRALCARLDEADAWFAAHAGGGLEAAYDLPLLRVVAEVDEHWVADGPPDLGLEPWGVLHAALLAVGEAAEHETTRFIAFVREELTARLHRLNQRTYDALLGLVADAVEAEPEGPLVAALRSRYEAVLIDEFQDTDARQWVLFDQVFGQARDRDGAPTHRLYLIGDPKQAIYAFRGADVFVYLEAKRVALAEGGREATMAVNHRSDGRLVHAMNALFRDHDRVLEQDGLRYVPVEHADRNGWADRYSGHAREAALTVRLVDSAARGESPPRRIQRKPQAREIVARLVAEDVRDRLSASPPLQVGKEALHPGHLAVLVRSHHEARTVERALREVGVPCIRGAQGNVFSSPEAEHLVTWLEAILHPRDGARARALALTPLGGFSAAALVEALEGHGGQAEWTAWLARIGRWANDLAARGVARVFGPLLTDPAFTERLAALAGVERRLTNYRHLLELLHAAELELRLGPAGLLRWLRDRRERQDADEVAELRLESDARAVQIVTIHASKGLQYPLVYVPFLWASRSDKRDAVLTYHQDGRRVLDLRPWPDREAVRAARQEAGWESLRLLYVALTRASHAATVYWAAQYSSRSPDLLSAPLTQVLFGEGDGLRSEAARLRVELAMQADSPPFEALATSLQALREAGEHEGDATIACLPATPPTGARWLAREAAPALAPPRVFPPRRLEHHWKRVSYSALTANRHGESARPDDVDLAALADLVHDGRDFADGVEAGEAVVPAPRAVPATVPEVPLAPFPGGPDPGTFVHRVLELIDFGTLRERETGRDLPTLLREEGPRHGITREEHLDLLQRALPGVLAQPLGEAAGGIALADLSTADRLDELDFNLALRGGDDHDPLRDAPVWWPELREVLARPRPAGSTVPESYLRHLRDESFRLMPLAGFLTGSIDLAYRVRRGREERWFVCDYKTNRLRNHEPDERGRRPITPAHYTLPWLQHEMAKHHYFLQYHLYVLALHRFLRQRLPGYDYDRNLGGAVYLFVRGMGEGAAPGQGVFVDRPPRQVIEGMDALFAGAVP